jgi:hypothetical protein
MAGNVWSINIIPGEACAVFAPDVYATNPGDPLKAQNKDVISWSNRTEQVHQPWPATADWQVDNNAQGLCETIQPWTASDPAYLVTDKAPATINYVCLLHPNEHGQIEVVP